MNSTTHKTCLFIVTPVVRDVPARNTHEVGQKFHVGDLSLVPSHGVMSCFCGTLCEEQKMPLLTKVHSYYQFYSATIGTGIIKQKRSFSFLFYRIGLSDCTVHLFLFLRVYCSLFRQLYHQCLGRVYLYSC